MAVSKGASARWPSSPPRRAPREGVGLFSQPHLSPLCLRDSGAPSPGPKQAWSQQADRYTPYRDGQKYTRTHPYRHASKYTTQPNHTGFTHKERHIPKLTKEKQTNLTYVHTQISTEKIQTSPSHSVETDTSHIYPCTNTHHISKDTQHKQSTRTKTHNVQRDHTHSTTHTYTHPKTHSDTQIL